METTVEDDLQVSMVLEVVIKTYFRY